MDPQNISLTLARIAATLGGLSLTAFTFLIKYDSGQNLIIKVILGIVGLLALFSFASCVDLSIDIMDDAQIPKIGETIHGRSNVPRYYSRDYLNQLPLRLFIFGFGYSTIALIIGGVFGVVVISVYELLDPGKFGAWSYAMATLWALIVVWKMMTLNSHPVAFSVFTAIVLTASIIPFIFRWTGLL